MLHTGRTPTVFWLVVSVLAACTECPLSDLRRDLPTVVVSEPVRFELSGLEGLVFRPYQDTFNIKELAEYRLTVPVFKQFVHASRLIVTATQEDARLANDPLFTRDISVLDDAVAAAARVEARLKFEPRYSSALRIASISAREYAKFSLALFAARMAHGFLQSGAIRGVTKGVAADNVAFIAEHEQEVADILRALGVEAQ
jgi:hypothetical protein